MYQKLCTLTNHNTISELLCILSAWTIFGTSLIIYRQRHLLRTAYFARGWRLIDRPKPSTCSYLPCSYLTIRLPPRCSGCLFLFQYSMSTCPIMLCSTVLLCKQQCSYFLSSIFFVIHLCQRHELPWPRP